VRHAKLLECVMKKTRLIVHRTDLRCAFALAMARPVERYDVITGLEGLDRAELEVVDAPGVSMHKHYKRALATFDIVQANLLGNDKAVLPWSGLSRYANSRKGKQDQQSKPGQKRSETEVSSHKTLE